MKYTIKDTIRLHLTEPLIQTILYGHLLKIHHHNDKYQLSHIEKVRIKFLKQKTILILSQARLDKLRLILNEKPTYWRLVIPNSDSDQSEELVLSMQRVIMNKDLPSVL